MKVKLFTFILFFSLFFINNQFAKEILIYADNIDYDEEKNLIARGNAKLIYGKEIITSDLVIVKEKEEKVILPIEFKYKDDEDNYYYGTSGEFSSSLDEGKINDLKMYLNDGSRIVGTEGYKKGEIDLVNKGVYSPCTSKIKIGNFICPIWQVDGEKILHDRDNLFIHTKHAKMRIFNVPVYYFPYMVTPSPLRKKRKSGFLNPTIDFYFIDVKSQQSTSFPYYWAISEDKEMLITPIINYGGGVDASQRFTFNYDQLISGGNLSLDLSSETNIENQDNESWLRDGSLIFALNQNLNETFNMSIRSSLQSSPTYLRRTDQNNFLNRSNTLSTTFNLNGYGLREMDDVLNFNISGYQVVRNNEDNKTTPTTLPYVSYKTGTNEYENTKYTNHLTFYNIFRETATADHAKNQQKIHHSLKTDNEFYKYYSKLNFRTELHSQYYNTEDKRISNDTEHTGTYGRIFPMSGIYIETPLINTKNNLEINPKASFVVNGSQPSSSKVSNEESTNNSYSLFNNSNLNRYTGTDKLDNSKRVNYGVETKISAFTAELGQSYEFDPKSNFNKDAGLKDHMSDLLGSSSWDGKNNDIGHNFRLNVDQGLLQSQSLNFSNLSGIGTTGFNYLQERKSVNSLLVTGTETLKINFNSRPFAKYSKINFESSFDLLQSKNDPTGYSLGYRYFDECFGINLGFNRSFYEDRDLKPQDNLTLTFSFKSLGAYKSTNLAVSEWDKQDIRWISSNVDNTNFR